MFVGDYNNGNLYRFKLNQNRTGLILSNTLADKIAYTPEDAKPVTFGTGFDGGITDLQVGPDGYLYVLTFSGAIYKIVPVISSWLSPFLFTESARIILSVKIQETTRTSNIQTLFLYYPR